MNGIIISAHGGRYSDQLKDLSIPTGSKIIYYVADGEVLLNDPGYEILYALLKGVTPATPIVQTVNAGQTTYDYSCWYAEEFQADCGIYQVGDDQKIGVIGSKPIALSQIFQDHPGVPIYWDCCRSISSPTEKLSVPAGAYPAKKPD